MENFIKNIIEIILWLTPLISFPIFFYFTKKYFELAPIFSFHIFLHKIVFSYINFSKIFILICVLAGFVYIIYVNDHYNFGPSISELWYVNNFPSITNLSLPYFIEILLVIIILIFGFILFSMPFLAILYFPIIILFLFSATMRFIFHKRVKSIIIRKYKTKP